MKIAIDARILGNSRALDYYTRNIIDSLMKFDQKNSYLILISDQKQLKLLSSDPSYKVLPEKIVLRDHFLFKPYLNELKIDLVFHPDNTEFLRCLPKSVVTLHDTLPWKFPEIIFSKDPFENLRQKIYFRFQERALKKSAHIITVSENSKKDIISFLKIPEEKITVTYEGVDKKFDRKTKIENKEAVLKKYGIEDDYIFYIGGLEKHKNVETLVKAFSLVDSHVNLVIGGKVKQESVGEQSSFEGLQKLIKDKNLGGKVIFTGFIEDQDLPLLYSEAKVFVYPSLYEGFGLPPLEAMRSGVPVVASKSASIPEVVGDNAVLVEPENILSMSEAIKWVLHLNKEKREKLIIEAKKYSEKFNWEKVSKRTIEIFNSLG